MPATQFETRNGINYAVGEDYAYCDRCGGRPIINDKCLKCDVPEPSERSTKLAVLISGCMHTLQHGSRFDGSGWESTYFNDKEAAKVIEAFLS